MARRRSIRVSLLRAVPAAGDLAANWAVFERLARRAAKEGAELALGPECFLDGYAVVYAKWKRRRLQAAGREAAEVYVPRCQALAAELGMALLLGTVYATPTRCTNSAVFIGPDGRRIGRYDKTHLAGHDLRFDAGRSLPVFDTPWGKMGIMICADRRWPEVARTLRVKGAQVILNPTYGMSHLANEWWMRTRSYENECYICFAHPKVSLFTGPSGEIRAKETGTRPGVLTAELDLRNLPRKMFSMRRPELYRAITRPFPSGRS